MAAANLPGFVDRALNRKRNVERKAIFGASPPLAPPAFSLPAGANRPNRSRPAPAEFDPQRKFVRAEPFLKLEGVV